MIFNDKTIPEKVFYYLFLLQLASIAFSIAIAQIFYAILFLLWLFLKRKQTQIEYTIFDAVFILFILLRILTVITSEFPSSSMITYTREIIFYPYYFVALYFIQMHGIEGIKKAIQLLLYSSAIASLYAVILVVSGTMSRGASLSGGYYVFSVHLAFVFAFSAAFLITEKYQKWRNILLLSLIIILAGIVSTYTRSMWVAVLLCCIAFGFFGYRKLLGGIVLAGAVLLLSVTSLRDRFLTIFSPAKNSSGRLEIWQSAADHILDHPYFGFGPETFKNIVIHRENFYDMNVASWHNEILQVQMESGIFATISLLVLYAMMLWFAIKTSLSRSESNYKLFSRLFIMFSLFIIAPAIVTGSIMFSILNGMILKFVFACFVYFAVSESYLKLYQLTVK